MSATSVTLGVTGSASASAPGAAVVVKAPDGAGKPTPGSGIATKAALNSPACTAPDKLGGYGRSDSSSVGNGPVCVRPFAEGDKNGGATSRGVTAGSVKVVYVMPAPSPASAGAALSTNRGTGQPGTEQDAVYDLFSALIQYYETWGRNIDIVFYQSTGIDEPSQRADALEILAEKPFAVINGDTTGLDVLEAELAKKKTMVFGYGTSPNEAEALAPYRWGGNDPNAALINAAEVVGKQLVGKKAEWAGSDAIKGQTRKFGLVAVQDIFDLDRFKSTITDYKGTIAVESTYAGNGAFAGDATLSQQQAPGFVGRMKQAGVTTVILAADVAMTKALMEEAVKQDWFPEWFQTGFTYIDFQPFTQNYPASQVSHMFGLALLTPFLETPEPAEVKALSGNTAPIDWYWGTGTGTTTPRITAGSNWLMLGIHSAGPDLTPQTFRQGLFSVPASGGSADDTPLSAMNGYGKTTGLPYDGYFASQLDFVPEWIDPNTLSPLPVTGGNPVKPAQMFVDGATRYKSGDWPTKKIPFFDASQAVTTIKTRPPGSPAPVAAPCTGCPSSAGSTTKPGSPSSTQVTIAVPASKAA